MAQKPKGKKVFARRSRNGCLTCRTRHLKCDETPGACNNCVSAGWKCSGYESTRLTHPGNKSTPSLTLQRFHRTFPGESSDERRGFAFFQSTTVRNMTSLFDSRLWTDLILPMSHSERAVNHAVVALSTLHEEMEGRDHQFVREDLSNRRQRFALEQYTRSLAMLNQRRNSQDPMFREVLLTCCLLFIVFELLRGNYDPAIMHLQQGRSIVDEQTFSPETRRFVESSLLKTMSRLRRQSIFFGGPTFIVPGSTAADDGMSIFESLLEARAAFDDLEGHVVSFLRESFPIPVAERLASQHPHLGERQKELHNQMHEYLERLRRSEAQILSGNEPRVQRGIALLHLHHKTFTICVDTILCGKYETIFGTYTQEFQTMLAMCERVSLTFREESSAQDLSRPTLLLDTGIVLPLFLIVWRCRHLPTRQRAMYLLEEWPHKEGLWDSRLLWLYGKKLMEVEVDLGSSHEEGQEKIEKSYFRLAEDQKHAVLFYRTKGSEPAASDEQKVVRLDGSI
ncbi:hypothetical protein N7474_000487 [Penicillium riverlandense]|uniref:uncharacterized protein n=1 Tax=Penicillium riverlandense TaxID=1903569 RepID=UPI0025482CAA|nr:uncharacterized protein N7474_000487 [Penicillium riverlandense]KAJ5832176.1 hypothetical protein N7474_000487 [Penicillium riverlandense]